MDFPTPPFVNPPPVGETRKLVKLLGNLTKKILEIWNRKGVDEFVDKQTSKLTKTIRAGEARKE